MSKSFISIFMSLLFLGFIATPTVVTFIDDSIDMSFYYSFAEEEEQGCEKNGNNKEKNILFLELNFLEADFISNEAENNLEYFFKKYTTPHKNLISPPPEVNI